MDCAMMDLWILPYLERNCVTSVRRVQMNHHFGARMVSVLVRMCGNCHGPITVPSNEPKWGVRLVLRCSSAHPKY